MIKGTQVYLSCNKLEKVVDSSFNCLNSENFAFTLPNGDEWIDFASESGYSCTKTNHLVQSCKPSPSGYYRDQRSHSLNSSSMCPAGSFYQDQSSQLQCKTCPPGQYVFPGQAPGKSPLQCITRPEGTQANETAGFRGCSCRSGFSPRYRFGSCKKCEVKGTQCERDHETLKQNFWWSWDYNRKCLVKYLAFVENLETKNNSYDRDSSTFNCLIPKAHQCLIKRCLSWRHKRHMSNRIHWSTLCLMQRGILQTFSFMCQVFSTLDSLFAITGLSSPLYFSMCVSQLGG